MAQVLQSRRDAAEQLGGVLRVYQMQQLLLPLAARCSWMHAWSSDWWAASCATVLLPLLLLPTAACNSWRSSYC
jgi:hypothetical protein